MHFAAWNFDEMNEDDVREEIVTPFLKRLGYAKGSQNDILRCKFLALRYPNIYLGRKNPRKDKALTGYADYICEIDKSIRWVIEAKGANEPIDADAIEQAFTYANHPEVNASVFCVFNGRELQIFQTNQAPGSQLLLQVTAGKMDARWVEIENLLSPEQMKTAMPRMRLDPKPPLGQGLRSSARVVKGHIHYEENSRNLPQLRDMFVFITDGVIERDNHGMVARLRTLSSFGPLQRWAERLGIEVMEIRSSDGSLSSDPNHPTEFSSQLSFPIRRGERVFDIATWQYVDVPVDMTLSTRAIGRGSLQNGVFSGSFEVEISNSFRPKESDVLRGTVKLDLE